MMGAEHPILGAPLVSEPLVGQVIDERYRIESPLGRGGMGQVWRVTHLESLQQFALKTLHPPLAADPRVVARFIQEARAAGGLKSRHIVRIIDARANYVHDQRPMPFVVMELLEGDSLEAFLTRSGRLSAAHTLWLAKQLALALDTIHAAGIVHRDLKPSNVFLAYDDDQQLLVKLCDFGLAKVTQALAPLAETGSGEILGTPLYMAPEQLRAVKQVGPATDLWAFGLLVYRALSGEDYFGRCTNTADLIVAVLQEPLTLPSRRAFGFPSVLDRWFLKACALSPEQRFANAKEMYHRLESALGKLAPESIHASHLLRAGQEPTAAQPQAPPRLHGQLSTATWLLLTLVPVGVVGVYVFGTHERGVSTLSPAHLTPPQTPEEVAMTTASDVTSATVGAIVTPPRPATTPEPQSPTPLTSSVPSALPAQSKPTRDAVSGRRPRPSGPTPPPRTPSTTLSNTAPSPDKSLAKASGEVCSRSSECHSGVCLASRCR